ncbi:MAG: acyltransferase family protein [Paludibacteraceae bacterium]
MSDKKENIQWLDTLRTLAILGVVLIHISSPITNTTFQNNVPYWWIGNILISITRYAVPVFLLLSGATMLGREYNIKKFYRKRVVRVVVPFLFWLIVYFFFRYFTLPTQQPPPKGGSEILNWALDLFFNDGVSKHFWYIYMILFIYILMPFLSKIARMLQGKYMVVFLVLWVIVAVWSTKYPANMHKFTDTNRLIKYFIYAGYLFVGFYLYKHIQVNTKMRLLSFVLFVITVAVCALTVYFSSIGEKRPNQSIYNYLSLNTILQAVTLFIAIKDTSLKNKITARINQEISNYSLGIYLAHIMVLGILYNHRIFWTMVHPLISVPIVFVLTFSISYFIVFLLRKIPYGKYIAG